jgi:hypothetical protein
MSHGFAQRPGPQSRRSMLNPILWPFHALGDRAILDVLGK